MIGWFSLSVASDRSEMFAERLLALANGRPSWPLSEFGATIVRCKRDDADEYLFSPLAAAFFESLFVEHGAIACPPPRVRELVPSRTSRMVLGFKTRWEPFETPQLPGKGITRTALDAVPLDDRRR